MHAGRALIVEPLTTFPIDVLFVPHLLALDQETDSLLDTHPALANHPNLDDLRPKNHRFAMTTTKQDATAHNVTMPTSVVAVEATTRPSAALPVGSGGITKSLPWTPIRPFVLERELSNYPDKAFVRRLVDNLRHGCAIGYEGPQFTHLANNLQSAFQQPTVIDTTLKEECEAGRILGPFQHPPLPNFRTSGLGLVPKHDGGWRIIYHLSAPHNLSINDFIDPSSYSLTYCTIDNAYRIINTLGPGALMSKIDLKNAFRLIPVRPDDWNLLGVCWRQQFYIDTCLPFGLRSAPHIFNELSTAIHWILQSSYGVKHVLHYLDDFFTAGPADSPVCAHNLQSMFTLCDKINAPIKMSKVEGPTTSLTFLGIQLNTITMEASVTPERKLELLHELHYMTHKNSCTKKELLSLIGKLSFCCKVLPAGRIFLRRMIDLSTTVQNLSHHIPLTIEAQLDIQWWINFLPKWSGKSLILTNEWTPSPTLHLYTDASGSHGWGAYWSGRWLQSCWTTAQQHMDITWKELFAIVSAVHTWGSSWSRRRILFHCDNRSVVDIWDKGSTRATHTMALVRLLYYCAVQHNLNVCVAHIPGVCNDIADALSRFQMNKFWTLTPYANPSPDNIPAWLTQTFMQASCSAGIMELPNQHGEPTAQALQSFSHSAINTTSLLSQHPL